MLELETATLSADREPFFDWTVILQCTKRTQNKCKIGQWRLLAFSAKIHIQTTLVSFGMTLS